MSAENYISFNARVTRKCIYTWKAVWCWPGKWSPVIQVGLAIFWMKNAHSEISILCMHGCKVIKYFYLPQIGLETYSFLSLHSHSEELYWAWAQVACSGVTQVTSYWIQNSPQKHTVLGRGWWQSQANILDYYNASINSIFLDYKHRPEVKPNTIVQIQASADFVSCRFQNCF